MTAPDFTKATWITSSYSGGNGGDCVEVAFVPADWRASSYSGGNGGNCVEVALTARVPSVGVRDSKDRDAGYLAVPSPAWRAFLRGVTPS
ncbi:DUF397 domain-containing protein [Haloechinothrix sp. YIM 98757]|uniref:DUF397 domain-containing protein n=1 Tax=Haloechinothrix aidingensis TaxID=2752311 RepID=A0A838A6W5_9PSEU|nr:DUF397 domain-containing protein [Haloechinothrix aidingensis]MBA0124001.1 DUF397 domain-containing protein [Haloechinothrix aidingensis]